MKNYIIAHIPLLVTVTGKILLTLNGKGEVQHAIVNKLVV